MSAHYARKKAPWIVKISFQIPKKSWYGCLMHCSVCFDLFLSWRIRDFIYNSLFNFSKHASMQELCKHVKLWEMKNQVFVHCLPNTLRPSIPIFFWKTSINVFYNLVLVHTSSPIIRSSPNLFMIYFFSELNMVRKQYKSSTWELTM